MVEFAPEAGALLLALEHRCYGESIPSADTYEYCTSK